MCLAIPGKIIKINGKKAVVKYPKETRDVIIAGIPVKVGDFVLVQMGIIIKTLSVKEASTSQKAWKNLN
jgi:hydrogenase expression/formation protein HypC